MVRLRAAELLGGGGRSHGGPEAEAAQRQQSVGDRVEEAPASWALQLQGAAALALVVLDRVLQTGVVDRHAIEGAKALGYLLAVHLLRPRDPRLFARLSLAWAILLLGSGVLLPLKRLVKAHQHGPMAAEQWVLGVLVVCNSAGGMCLALAAAAREAGTRRRGGVGVGAGAARKRK